MPTTTNKTRRSFGCDTCRKRKIRCDRSANSCKNCKSAGWVCDGYPDSFDVVLRDQTTEVTRRAQGCLQGPSRKSPSERQGRKDRSRTTQPLRLLIPDRAEAAVAFFMAHHVMNASSTAHYYAPGKQDSVVRQALFCATAAVGLAEISSLDSSNEALTSSISYYTRAVKLINLALDNTAVLGDDLFLISIYTLTAYETVTGRRSQSMDAWTAHIRGAATLLEMRGPEQFQNSDNVRIFTQIVLSLMVACLENYLALPDSLVHLCQVLRRHVPIYDCMGRFFFTSITLVQHSAAIHNQQELDVEKILTQGRELDEEYKHIAEHASYEPLWNVKRYHSRLNMSGACHHAFPNYLAAEFWYRLWSARLQVHKNIIHLAEIWLPRIPCPSVTERIRSEAHRSSLAQRSMSANILANVPQHLTRKSSSKQAPSRFLWDNFISVVWQCAGPQTSPAQLPQLRLEGGYGLLRSLRAIGCDNAIDAETRTQAAELLTKIGRQMGVRLAWDFAKDVTAYNDEGNALHLVL